jgi:hypothetical protein
MREGVSSLPTYTAKAIFVAIIVGLLLDEHATRMMDDVANASGSTMRNCVVCNRGAKINVPIEHAKRMKYPPRCEKASNPSPRMAVLQHGGRESEICKSTAHVE